MCYLLHQYFASLLERKLLPSCFTTILKSIIEELTQFLDQNSLPVSQLFWSNCALKGRHYAQGVLGKIFISILEASGLFQNVSFSCSPGITGPMDACTFSSIFPYLCLISSTLSVKWETSILNAQNREINHSLYIFFDMVSSQRTCCLFYI